MAQCLHINCFPGLQKNGVTLDYTIYDVVYNPIGNMKQLLVVKFIVSVSGIMRMMHGCHIITLYCGWSISRDYKANPTNIICVLFCIPSF